ncbi:MAG TPA: Gfo/Idh/MocA family oxidoreductase [Bacteroidota bacterium]|jgi:predicted dehydrogenase|nr:Gfo/Idh/MocA family oxidoreductase [Bacteroidota bacterium]
MLRGAVIGLGNIATRGHLPAYRDNEVSRNLEIVAVMDVVEQNKEKAREHVPGAAFYTDIDELLSREKLDFVDICTPPHTHAEYIRACASKGLHIICEKPLTETNATVDALSGLIKGSKIVFVPCHQYKYSPLWKSIRDVIFSGGIGDVTIAQFNVFRLHADSGTAAWNPEWRTNKKHSGGGILVDTGAHYFYLTQYLFGIPQNVSSVLRTLKHHEYGVEDTALVTLEYPGALVQINLTWAANSRSNSAFIIGTKGSLAYDGSRLIQTSEGISKELPMPDVSDKKQYIGWYAALFTEFASRVVEKNCCEDLLNEAVVVMKLLDLCYRSKGNKIQREYPAGLE